MWGGSGKKLKLLPWSDTTMGMSGGCSVAVHPAQERCEVLQPMLGES